jgi:hypothetical protein
MEQMAVQSNLARAVGLFQTFDDKLITKTFKHYYKISLSAARVSKQLAE